MDVWQNDKLAMFIIFFVPGFISMKIYDLLVPGTPKDFSKALPEAIGYSALNFGLLSWLIFLILAGDFRTAYPGWYYASLFLILFITPIIWPVLFLKVVQWGPMANLVVHPVQKPWDWVFGKKEAYWVIVHLTDGRRIGGRYDIGSFASSYPSEEQIYLIETWELDEAGRFIKPVERSKGILILGREISTVEFFGG
jgi:hypothetical protein